MGHQIEAAIVRVHTADRRVVGAGLLVDQRHVLTCAHVVDDALGRPRNTQCIPRESVCLDFPFLQRDSLVTARVASWYPREPDLSGDIAVLEIDVEDRHIAGAAPLPLIPAEEVWGHPFRVYGFPRGHGVGVWAIGVLRGRNAVGWVQIESQIVTGYSVREGFSGGPVWDDVLGGVVGIVSGTEIDPEVKAAFIIPTELLATKWTELPISRVQTGLSHRTEEPSSATPVPSGLPPFTQGHALLVGVGAYHHLGRLSKTTYDAQNLRDLLLDPVYAGYPRGNVRLLLDEKATKGAINDELDRLARRVGSEDTVVIFFSGHGAQRVGGFEPGEYLCPVEADWYNLRGSAISTDELTNALGAIHASRIAIFLDACHSGGVGQPKDAALQVQPGLSANTYERLAEGQGRVIIASCRPNEVSWELGELTNGLFAHYLLEGLRGGAAGPDGAVRILDLFKYVSREVPKLKDQHPLLKGTLEDDFAISVAPAGRQ